MFQLFVFLKVNPIWTVYMITLLCSPMFQSVNKNPSITNKVQENPLQSVQHMMVWPTILKVHSDGVGRFQWTLHEQSVYCYAVWAVHNRSEWDGICLCSNSIVPDLRFYYSINLSINGFVIIAPFRLTDLFLHFKCILANCKHMNTQFMKLSLF